MKQSPGRLEGRRRRRPIVADDGVAPETKTCSRQVTGSQVRTAFCVSALELRRQLGITYNAAWRMKHKLMQVMKERDDCQPLEGVIQLDDAYWGGERRGGKRGRGA